MDSSPFTVNPGQKMALEVRDATFEWEESLSVKEAKEAKAKTKKKGKDADAVEAEVEDSPPFQMRNVTMLVPRGSLVAIVGAVGSGKVCDVAAVLLKAFSSQLPVESAQWTYWRDAEGSGPRILWRIRCILRSDCLDPECHAGRY